MTDLDNLPRLSRAQFWTCFAILFAIFLFGAGPVWERAYNIDLSVYYSYIPIPFLVLACLLVSRKLTLRGFFLDSLELTLVKFGITYSIAIVLWAATSAPPPMPHAHHIAWAAPAPPAPPPLPTVIPADQKAVLSGVVVDAKDAPAAGAVVFVSAGLDGYVFAAPEKPVQFVHDGSGLLPPVSIAQVYQPIEARSADGRLHNIVATTEDDAPIFNAPLLPSGTVNHMMVREPHRRATLRCTVHQHSSNERTAELIVLSHPFFTTTAKDGSFRFDGVPAGSLQVTAMADRREEVRSDVSLQGAGEAHVRLVLAPQ